MKKSVKIILIIILVAAAGAGYAVYSAMPVDVETVRLAASDVAEYFIEEGSVKAAETVDVFSAMSGKIAETLVAEDQAIVAGDVICRLDASEFENAVKRTQAAIDGYKAQISNLEEQRLARASELNASLVGLRSELDVIEAQESDYLERAGDETETANEATSKANRNIAAGNAQIDKQLELQQILVEQAQAAYDRLLKNAEDAGALFNTGAISHQEYDAALKARDDAKSALDAAAAQIGVIKASRLSLSGLRDVKTYTAYYESMKRSLRERIAVVENQLAEDYTKSMRQYYEALIAGEETQIKSLEKSAADCAVESPVSGRIAKLYIKNANIINAAMPIAQIETERYSDIEVFVATKDYADIRLNDRVEITQPASSGDKVFWGAVKEIGDEAVTRVTTLGISERAVRVTVAPDGAYPAGGEDASGTTGTAGGDNGSGASGGAGGANITFLPGFSFEVKFFTFMAENQITVPKTAVFKYSSDRAAGGVEWLDGDLTGQAVADADMVYCATGGALRMRQVRLGRELRSDYIVEAGLAPGDAVVRDAMSDKAKPGVKVNV